MEEEWEEFLAQEVEGRKRTAIAPTRHDLGEGTSSQARWEKTVIMAKEHVEEDSRLSRLEVSNALARERELQRRETEKLEQVRKALEQETIRIQEERLALEETRREIEKEKEEKAEQIRRLEEVIMEVDPYTQADPVRDLEIRKRAEKLRLSIGLLGERPKGKTTKITLKEYQEQKEVRGSKRQAASGKKGHNYKGDEFEGNKKKGMRRG